MIFENVRDHVRVHVRPYPPFPTTPTNHRQNNTAFVKLLSSIQTQYLWFQKLQPLPHYITNPVTLTQKQLHINT